jgi:hypothetical protein
MYLGNQPALSYTSFAKQDFTTSATTSYTLDNPVANENEIALFINFVRQEPTTAYTASGTSLTLTSATSASDDMYCVFLGKAVQTVNPPNGSVGLSQLSATGTKDSTTFLRGDNTFATAGGTMTPAFQANLSSNQSVTNNTYTKIQCNTEIFDTNSAYDNSTNYRFTVPSGEAGRYFIYGNIGIYGNTTTDVKNAYLSIYKNGTLVHENRNDIGSTPYETQIPITIASILDLSVSDYVELYGLVNTNSGSNGLFLGDSFSNKTFFGAYKIIE